jgi:hypothetical protein
MILHKQAYGTYNHDATDRDEDGATMVVHNTKQGSTEMTIRESNGLYWGIFEYTLDGSWVMFYSISGSIRVERWKSLIGNRSVWHAEGFDKKLSKLCVFKQTLPMSSWSPRFRRLSQIFEKPPITAWFR